MRHCNLKCILLLISVFSITSVYAETAKLTYAKGKVEIYRNDKWIPLNVGDLLKDSDTISTGFQSEAKIEYNGSIMALGALTRISLEKLASSETKDDVSIYLKTGSVRSKVSHPQSKKVSYVVKTPIAVASVRGTDFTVTASGHVFCSDGAVAVYTNKDNRKIGKASKKIDYDETEEPEEGAVSENVAVAIENSPSATTTTKAQDINADAPAGTVVVGKNQAVTIQKTGNPENPIANAIRKKDTVKNTVTTAADKEKESIGGSGTIAKSIKENVPESDAIPVTALSVQVIVVEDVTN